jgi:DNA-binding HxlR family transcriptional regulator
MKSDCPQVWADNCRYEGCPHVPVTSSICSVHWLARQFGDTWSLPVLCRLADGPMRFSQLRNCLGPVSQRMLTRTLKKLERIGIVSRRSTEGFPLTVTYALTERGMALLDPLWRLHMWMRTHGPYPADKE